MAKPKALKVKNVLHFKDLVNDDKVHNGDKVCFLLPLNFLAKTQKRKYKFVRGTLRISYSFCECCGHTQHAFVERASGTRVVLVDEWKGGGCLGY